MAPPPEYAPGPHQFGAITFLFPFFKINGELGVMYSLEFYFCFRRSAPICSILRLHLQKSLPLLGQRSCCGTVLQFEQEGPDHLDSPLVTSASIVPTIGLQTKLEAKMSCDRVMLRLTDIGSLSS